MDTTPPYTAPAARPWRLIALHASAGSSQQWQALPAALGPEWQVVLHDHIDHGRGPAWAGPQPPTLQDHVAALRPLLFAGEEPAHLVAHSFGAVVALQAAVEHPERVASLALYEPVLIALLRAGAAASSEEEAVFRIADRVRTTVAAGRLHEAAQGFVTYWSGPDAWAALDERARDRIALRMSAVAAHFDVIETAQPLVRALPQLRVPVLLLVGSDTTAAARGIAHRLPTVLAMAQCQTVTGAGHMGPLTHRRAVLEHITAFLWRTGLSHSRQGR